MSDQDTEPAAEPREGGAQFSLQRIYMKDMSFESPRSPAGFRGQWRPKVNLELNSRYSEIEESHYEVVLSLTTTARDDADEVVYLVEVQQAGIFLVKGMAGDALQQTLGSFCPNVLFPYAREAIDSIVTRGSFPPLMLAPVNFDAIYEQAKAQREQKEHPTQ
ncbi:MAG: protein-export chaperone SecB [Gammaproteobacteria bacterium]|nr:protein-export chaperone SecB [Gammaproteobacteria bacterium]